MLFVVPAPRLKRDYVGRRVRTTKMLRNGYAELPAGSLAVVVEQSKKGSSLRFDRCTCCGVSIFMTGIGADVIEFVEEQLPLLLEEDIPALAAAG